MTEHTTVLFLIFFHAFFLSLCSAAVGFLAQCRGTQARDHEGKELLMENK